MAALVLALACSKCSDGGEWCKESRGKKSGRKEKGERRVSSPSLLALSTSFFFSLAFLCTVPHYLNAWI